MKLTIYTPAYNKGETLNRTFESLLQQTNHDFEWILINDGSTNQTDLIVKQFKTPPFRWRYINKKNEGLSSVMNLAAQECKTEFILRLDADDYLTPQAVETILKHLDDSEVKSSKIAALVFLTCYSDGKRCGYHPFSTTYISTFWDYRFKYKAIGDRAEVFKNKIFSQYPMPVFKDERFCSEGFTWNKISDSYDAIYYTDAIYVRDYVENSITTLGAQVRIKNPKGEQLVLSDILNRRPPLKIFIKASILYYRYSLHANYPLRKLIKDIPLLSTAIGIIPGSILYLIEKYDNTFINKIKKITNQNS